MNMLGEMGIPANLLPMFEGDIRQGVAAANVLESNIGRNSLPFQDGTGGPNGIAQGGVAPRSNDIEIG